MTILVTGGQGFIGSNFVQYNADKAEIVVVDALKSGFSEGLKETVEWYLENEWWWKLLADEQILHPTPWKLRW